MSSLFAYSLAQLIYAARSLVEPLPFFVLLAALTKGRAIFRDVRATLSEARIAILILVSEALLFAPILVASAILIERLFAWVPWRDFWTGWPLWAVALVGVLVGDFAGYWRHRLEHSELLWPSHAIHHSDTAMTWLAIFRFHPINRLSTVFLDGAAIAVLGLPPYAIIANSAVRHFYGAFIHADLPWTYGHLGRIFVSPAMHRWHHAKDKAAFNTNYATVFSMIDIIFGTYRVPGPCDVPLGVSDDMGSGFIGQYVYPFRPRSYAPVRRARRRKIIG
ncbi:conserved membrane hypothetical protein [Mesorhizobium plurifarium]|uniref:Fatty acid hydroxylase domain-containing protein n=1 Tax=Mesorhizobium plurifarium TaxID=69974 RepID=A0A090G2I2_MESPL|nr:conserved membrane hypothetical protein [Mesorhizobium plurifarium]